MNRSSAWASIMRSGRNGVSMIGDRQITSRWVTTKRLDRPCDCRCNVTFANKRCEVELPISIPIVFSSTESCAQMSLASSALSASVSGSCSWSKSRSCLGSLDHRNRCQQATRTAMTSSICSASPPQCPIPRRELMLPAASQSIRERLCSRGRWRLGASACCADCQLGRLRKAETPFVSIDCLPKLLNRNSDVLAFDLKSRFGSVALPHGRDRNCTSKFLSRLAFECRSCLVRGGGDH
jgi:hypothetical protein